MGIEPTLAAWKAEVLPLNYTRLKLKLSNLLFLNQDTLYIGITPTSLLHRVISMIILPFIQRTKTLAVLSL